MTQEKTTTTTDVEKKILISYAEAAKLTGIGINKLRSMSRKPTCPFAFFIGGHGKIKREALLEYIAQNRKI